MYVTNRFCCDDNNKLPKYYNFLFSIQDLRIKFSEVLETTHEYPSEASLLQVEDDSAKHEDSTAIVSPKSNILTL